MSTLVTGGAGYIGSHTVRQLRSLGRDVVVLDTMEYGNAEAIPGVPLVVGDIADGDLVASTIAEHGVDQVVHFAAYKNVGESMLRPDRYWLNNITGTVKLVEAMLGSGVRDIVFSSSCSVNGTPDAMPVDEDAPIRPESVYAESKATVERILTWYGVTKGLRSVSLRYFNASGAALDGSHGEVWEHSLNLIPLVMKATLGLRPAVHVFGNDYPTHDGTCIRDYVHVDDLADAHVRALDHLAADKPSTILNVGTGVGSSVLDVITATEAVAGIAVPYEIVPRRAGDPVATYADPTRIGQVLGWRAERSLHDIVASAWLWHSTHPQGYAG